jgi:hypothetical protein
MEGSSHGLMSYIGIVWVTEGNDGWPVVVVKILTRDLLLIAA